VPFLDELNPQQREAVETADGPILILAGAGSGKTRVITYRIAHLIEHLGVQPESILAVTFTNKAAQEMAERVAHVTGGRSFAKPWISTFHSMCVRMLRRDVEALRIIPEAGSPERAGVARSGVPVGYTKQFAIYDEADQQSLVKAAIRRLGLDDKQLTPRTVLARISWAKNHMLDPQEVFLQSSDPKSEQIAHVYEIYRQELRKANAMDFDDLLLETVRLLKVAEPVRRYWNRRFQYILIDEYQDTNRPQYELMRLLAGERHNVCAVGDEDQSIYSWRGADIRNILEFERDFPDAKIIRLEQNYRSTQNILSAASAVVANNVKRKGKNLWTSRQGGNRVGYYEAPDGENEALFAADLFSKYLEQSAQEGNDRARAAVLYRTNAQSRLFEEAMRRYQLQYHVVGGFSFYERAEIKDMISYLKVVQNPDDSVALLRVINTPARGIGRTTLDTLERLALETGASLWGAIENAVNGLLVPARAVASLKNFRDIIQGGGAMVAGTYAEWLGESVDESPSEPEDRTAPEAAPQGVSNEDESFDFGANVESSSIESFSNNVGPGAVAGADSEDTESSGAAGALASGESRPAATAALLKYLLDRTGYIKQLEEEDTPESLARVENLRELVNAAMDSRDRGESLQEFLDHAALVSEQDQYDAAAKITLMTLHSAKGLEFPLVFLAGMEEGLFPHSRTFLNPDDIEEERRLCYVGMTRAMDQLIVSRARYRRRYGTDMPEASIPSRFLEEIPPQLLEDLGEPRRASWDTEQKIREYRDDYASSHYDYESEDQRPSLGGPPARDAFSRDGVVYGRRQRASYSSAHPTYNSIDNIAEFFASRGRKFTRPKVEVPEQTGRTGFRPGQKVKHPKYGEGVVHKREGDGDDAKITVQFPRFGLKKLVEKYAQLERV
jgi:DNA helicase-2/ATP-dependent DNA helicase PcrA